MTPAQHAAAAAFGQREEREETVADFLDRLRETRSAMVEGLSGLSGLEVRSPEGGIFLFARVAGGRSSSELVDLLLEEAGVAAVPGEAFAAPGHVRFNFAVEPETVREGVRRIREFLS